MPLERGHRTFRGAVGGLHGEAKRLSARAPPYLATLWSRDHLAGPTPMPWMSGLAGPLT